MLHTFHGGIRPAGRKEATRRSGIQPLEPGPARVALPLAWCGGAAELLVQPGDTVGLGQVLARPEGEGIPLRASVSGTVAAVERRAFPSGRGEAVVLESDGHGAPAPAEELLRPVEDPEKLTSGEILRRLREAGVTDRGEPLYLRLRRAVDRAEVLVVNGMECEPYVTADHRILLERSARVLGGLRLMLRVLGLREAVLAVGGDKGDAIAALQKELPLRGGPIRLVTPRVRHPLGDDRMLAEWVTGREVPAGGGAEDVECLVVTPAAAAAAWDAVRDGRAQLRSVLTVAGGGVERPGNYEVPMGTTVGEVLRLLGREDRAGRVVLGGPMTGRTVLDLELPLERGAGAVLALEAAECARYQNENGVCLHCGRCLSVCPMGLEPCHLLALEMAGAAAELEAQHVEACIECGACSYVCPAHLPLTRGIRRAKRLLRERRREGEE